MNFIMSAILYNPLEMFFIFFANKTLNNINNINKNFIKGLYFSSFILLIFQYLTENLSKTLIYIPLAFFTNYILLPLISYIFIKPKKFIVHLFICFAYAGSIVIAISFFNLPFAASFLDNKNFQEFYINITLKIIQFLILFFIKGVFYVKKFFKKRSKKKYQ